MDLELPSILVGALVTIVVAVAGRVIWRAIEQRLNGIPSIIYFVSHERETSLSEKNEEVLSALIWKAKDGGDEAHSVECDGLRDEIRKARFGFDLIVENIGSAKAKDIMLLLSGKPVAIKLSPDFSIHSRETADGKFEYIIPCLEPQGQLRIGFSGLSPYAVRSVSFQGGDSKRYTGDGLLPKNYIYDRERKRGRRIYDGIFIAWIIFSLAAAIYSFPGIRKNSENAEASVPQGLEKQEETK
jgi:hypothetical protein